MALHVLAERDIGSVPLAAGAIDTTPPGGRLVFHVFAAPLAEFERDLITERTNVGLASTHARGRPSAMSADQVKTARRLYSQQDMTAAQIGDVLGVSRTTIYRNLNRHPATTPARRRSQADNDHIAQRGHSLGLPTAPLPTPLLVRWRDIQYVSEALVPAARKCRR